MSIKRTLDEAYSCGENIFIKNQNHNLDENCIKKSYIYKGKRKRITSIKMKTNKSCVNCKKEKENKDIIKFKNKSDLIKQIQSFLANKNIPQLIKKIRGKINRNKYICLECFKDIIKTEDYFDKIKNLLFIKKRKKVNNNLSLYPNKSSDLEVKKDKEKDDINNNKGNEHIIINNKNLFINKSDELEECFKNIVQCLKLAVFEVSCFVQSFKIYNNNIGYVNNIIQNENNTKFFFHCFIQTTIRLDNLYMLINNVVIKYKNLTKRILNSINLKNNEDFRSNYDLFIYNTNLILANILCFINNYNICLHFLRHSK